MFVIGGNSSNYESRLIYRLDLHHWTWETIPVKGQGPVSLDEHAACISSDEEKVVTYGGFINGERSSQIHILHMTQL